MEGFISKLKQLAKKSPIPLSKNHLYDIQTRRILQRVLRADSCAIDVGCHKGEILDLILEAAPKGTHFGFEPIPSFYDALKEKYSDKPSVHIVNVAASDEKGVSKFNFVTSNPSYSGLKKRVYDRDDEVDEQIEVRVDKIDHIIPKEVQVDLVKIDVEGAELLVLKGAIEVLRRCKPTIVFEHGLGASDVYGSGPGDIFSLLEHAGVRVSTMGRFLSGKSSFSKVEFERQYYDRLNYYFIAYDRSQD